MARLLQAYRLKLLIALVANGIGLFLIVASSMAALDSEPLSFFDAPWRFKGGRSMDLRFQWCNFRVLLAGENPYRIWLDLSTGRSSIKRWETGSQRDEVPDTPPTHFELMGTMDKACFQRDDVPCSPGYLPSSLLIMSPLLVLPWQIARIALLAVNLWCLAYLGRRIGSVFCADHAAAALAIGTPILLALPNTWWCIAQGQYVLPVVASAVALDAWKDKTGPKGTLIILLLSLLCTVKPTLFIFFAAAVFAILGWRMACLLILFHLTVNSGYSLLAYGDPFTIYTDWLEVSKPFLRIGQLNVLEYARRVVDRDWGRSIEPAVKVTQAFLIVAISLPAFFLVRRRPRLYLLVAGITLMLSFSYSYKQMYDFAVFAILIIATSTATNWACKGDAVWTVVLLALGVYFGFFSALGPAVCLNSPTGYRATLVGFVLWNCTMFCRFAPRNRFETARSSDWNSDKAARPPELTPACHSS